MRDELMDMFILYKKEKVIIQQIVNGHFSNGIKSFNIPDRDIPKPPNRDKF